jgi:colanic acid biosynthesis glycosyl transferase WcaI
MPRQILLITQLFDPENAIKGLSFAKMLVKKGYEVEVLTAFPSYPGGKIYPAFNQKLRQVEFHDGVKIVRLPSYISHDSSILKRMLNYGSFGFSCLMHGIFFSKRPHLIYAYHPAIVAGLVAWILGVVKRAPFVYDVQDLWPDALTDSGTLKIGNISKSIGKVADFIYRKSAHVIVLSDGYRKILMNRGVAGDKITRIYNWCDESRVKTNLQVASAKLFDTARFNILYAGNFGAAQGLTYVLDAAKIVQQTSTQIQFILMGDGIESQMLITKVQDEALRNVIFLPRLPIDQVGEVVKQADALLIHLKSSPAYEVTIPSKTQSSLALGKPILMATSGEAADLVSRAHAGVFSKPCDAANIASAAIELSNKSDQELDRMGKNAARFYEENLSMAYGVAALDAVLNRAMGKSNVIG